MVWKTKLIENFQPANDFAPSFVASIVKNGEIILVLDLSFPLLLTAIYSWGKTHLSLSHTKSAIMLLEYKTRFGPLYSMSFCFLIETYNKGSFMINMHCAQAHQQMWTCHPGTAKTLLCANIKTEKLKNLIWLIFFILLYFLKWQTGMPCRWGTVKFCVNKIDWVWIIIYFLPWIQNR